jgi:tape measure domain-containing protein
MAQDIKVALTLDNKQFNSALKDSQKKAKSFSKDTTKEVNGLTTAFKGLVAAIGVREIISLGDEFTTLNNRLKAVTNSQEEAASAFNLVRQVASTTRADLASVASLFSDITLATEEMGLTQQQVATVASTFSKALKVSGADAGAAAGAIRQFGQALASGVLRGDEFNSINEANSKFMGEFAKQLGVTRGELRDMAKDGVLTSEVILQATQRMAKQVDEDFAKTSSTIGESFVALRNSMIVLFGTLEQETGVFGSIADGINRIAPLIKTLAQLAAAIGLVFGSVKLLRTGIPFLKDIGDEIFKIGTGTGLAAKGGNLLNKAFRSLYGIGVQLKKAMKALFSAQFVKSIRAVGFAILYAGRAFVIFTGLAGIVVGVATAINLLVKALTGFSIVDWVVEKFKALWGWMRKTLVNLGLMEAVQDDVTSAIDDTTTAIEDNTSATDDNASSVLNTAKALETYIEFLARIKSEAKDAATISEYQRKAVEDLRKAYDSSEITLEQYREALDSINASMIDVAERLEGATDAVNEFNDSIAESTADLQKELDQLNMSEFQKSQDDIRRNLEELRDETLRDLQDELAGLDVVIDADAIKDIKDKMEGVKTATDAAILAQQDLGKQGYDASRLFSTGWDQALQEFRDNVDDKASKAKEVFTTFTKGVEDAFVNFAKTGKLSFKDLLDSMVEMLIRSQIQNLMSTLLGASGSGGIGDFFSKIFGRQQGGPVQGGTPYVVGEQGPELFVPNSSGTVVPNNKLGGGQTVNNTYITNSISAVDAKSVAQLFAENRKTLLGTVQMAQKEMPYG